MMSDADRRLLLQMARAAINAHVHGLQMPRVPESGVAEGRSGVFVSLHKGGELRGCIGHIEADLPLGVVVARCAVAACSADPRFAPVSPWEMPALEIELSVLGSLEPIADPAEIEIGRHGLVVEKGWYRGLLLPQVATEWRWDADMFLAQTCHKAGLPRDAWRHGAKIWRFEAEVFGENPGRDT